MNSHVETLQQKHHELDRFIANEQSRPLPDRQTLIKLKQKKLHIKEELSRLAS